jgi:hypothetical protein
MLLSLVACFYGFVTGSLGSLPYPDPPPPEVLAAAHARERTGDIIVLVGGLVFMASLLWIVTRYRRSHTS